MKIREQRSSVKALIAILLILIIGIVGFLFIPHAQNLPTTGYSTLPPPTNTTTTTPITQNLTTQQPTSSKTHIFGSINQQAIGFNGTFFQNVNGAYSGYLTAGTYWIAYTCWSGNTYSNGPYIKVSGSEQQFNLMGYC